MKRIGLTGVIGSGKSRVAAALASITGWPLLNCDDIAAALMAPEQLGWQAIKGVDSTFINGEGTLDRVALRQAIFSDNSLRQQLDALIHPLVLADIDKQLLAFEPQPNHVIIEVPLLFEAGWQDLFALTICVSAPAELCVARIMARDQVSASKAKQAIAGQMAMEEKIKLADHIIDNSGSWQETQRQVAKLAPLLAKFS